MAVNTATHADTWACPYGCVDGPLADVAASDDEWSGSTFLRFAPCCEGIQNDIDVFGFDDAMGMTVGEFLSTRDPALNDVRSVSAWDGYLVRRLTTRVLQGGPDQRMAFEFIAEHHRHHLAPPGWKFGLSVANGTALVAVAVVGRPVSRVLQERGVLEVTRVAAAGPDALRFNACSALYAAAARETRRRGHAGELITYTLHSESGSSLKAAGWIPEHRSPGGSWDTPSRRRGVHAPTVPKVRWHAPTVPRRNHSTDVNMWEVSCPDVPKWVN